MAVSLGAQAEHGVVWEPNHLDLLPYLQETPDILAGCQQMAHFEHDDAVCSDILFCRLLEMLVAHGMGSALCQQLLQHEGIQRALAHACRPETRALARRCEAPFLQQGFLVFYERATYRNSIVWERLRAPTNALVRACRAAVRDFRDWWLRGHGAPREEFEERKIGGRTLVMRVRSTADEAAQAALSPPVSRLVCEPVRAREGCAGADPTLRAAGHRLMPLRPGCARSVVAAQSHRATGAPRRRGGPRTLEPRDPATTGVLCGDKNPPVTTGLPPPGRRFGGRQGGAECLGRGVYKTSKNGSPSREPIWRAYYLLCVAYIF